MALPIVIYTLASSHGLSGYRKEQVLNNVVMNTAERNRMNNSLDMPCFIDVGINFAQRYVIIMTLPYFSLKNVIREEVFSHTFAIVAKIR
jgi:hypothetical protein